LRKTECVRRVHDIPLHQIAASAGRRCRMNSPADSKRSSRAGWADERSCGDALAMLRAAMLVRKRVVRARSCQDSVRLSTGQIALSGISTHGGACQKEHSRPPLAGPVPHLCKLEAPLRSFAFLTRKWGRRRLSLLTFLRPTIHKNTRRCARGAAACALSMLSMQQCFRQCHRRRSAGREE
jgi:hypothetical protein